MILHCHDNERRELPPADGIQHVSQIVPLVLARFGIANPLVSGRPISEPFPADEAAVPCVPADV